MSEGAGTDERIVGFLKEKGPGTVDEISAALEIGRTTTRKYLAGLTVDDKVDCRPGGREGRRKLPDVFSLPDSHSAAKPTKAVSKSKSERLAPGELDKLVLGYMRRRKKDAPHTPSAVAKAINRSSGAIANCLARQEKQRKVRLVKTKPREYELVEAKKR